MSSLKRLPRKSKAGALPRVVVIVGPTASGKTALGIKLAKQFNGEIISADSRQIYQGMDIGTAKPTKDEQKMVRHHLIDFQSPAQLYTVAQYKKDCIRTIKSIIAHGKSPILVGGTGLYVKAVVDNLDIPAVPANVALRSKLEKELKTKGSASLYQKLTKLDPESASLVDRYNPQRIIRAIEIITATKQPLVRTKGKPLFEFLRLGLDLPAQELRKRIGQRVVKWVKHGLVREVRQLLKEYPSDTRAFNAIGYRETIDYLQGKISLNEVAAKIKQGHWQLAKRQMTWFRKDKRIHWITTQKEAEKLVQQFLK